MVLYIFHNRNNKVPSIGGLSSYDNYLHVLIYTYNIPDAHYLFNQVININFLLYGVRFTLYLLVNIIFNSVLISLQS